MTHSVRYRPEASTLLPKPKTTHREPGQPPGCSEGGVSPRSVIALQKPLRQSAVGCTHTKTEDSFYSPRKRVGDRSQQDPQPFRDPRNDQCCIRPGHLDLRLTPTHVTAAIASKRVPRRPRITFQAGVQASVSNHQSSEQWPEWGIWVQPWARCDSLPQTCPCWGTCDHLLCPWKLSPEGQEEAVAAVATHPLVLYCVLSAVT